MKIIAGLGNPGKEYESTRHNVGFMVLDSWAKKLGLEWEDSKKFKAQIIRSADLTLIKPQTYMNNSGLAVAGLMNFYKYLPKAFFSVNKDSDLSQTLTVIHDDIDIVLGKYKFSFDSRPAGHKGVISIMNCLKTQRFNRLRIGIKTGEKGLIPTEKFVLQKFPPGESSIIKETIEKIKIQDFI